MAKLKWTQITEAEAVKQFSNWAFEIKKAHWPALGVQSGYYTKDKVLYFSYKQSQPVVYEFHEGDVFHGKAIGILQVLQVAANVEVKLIENGYSVGYLLSNEQLGQWLESGVKPDASLRMSKSQSSSEIAKFYEYTE